MSDQCSNSRANKLRKRDAGMTLPELMVSTAILGLLMTVLSSAIIVTLRQQDNTDGRLNVARAEQSVSMYMPSDLSSASEVFTNPDATPCGATVCDGIDLSKGSNVMMLTWTTEANDGTVTTTNVSYHFAPSGDGVTYNLSRVECASSGGPWKCTSRIVLRDLPGPPAGETFVPGVAYGAACNLTVNPVPCTRPTWVIIVSEPLAPDAIRDDQFASESDRKDANRVVVSINGGGDVAGAGGGINQISITAGGTKREPLSAKSTQGTPSFVEARSRCGGPITLVIDESGSIGSTAINDVKDGVKKFILAVAGTPVTLQVVGFSTKSRIVGSATEWHHYFDMTNQADVTALLTAVDGLTSSGNTNWEDALFRTFYEADGSTASIIPETVVFFTDGVPTMDRLVNRSTPGVLPAAPPAPGLPWAVSTGSVYSQVAFNRADYISNKFRRNVRMIGVGVGQDIAKSSPWVVDPGAGYRTTWERGSYSHVVDTFKYEARYQKRNSGSSPYYWVNKATYDAAASNRRKDVNWTVVTEAAYRVVENPPNTNSNDGLRWSVTSAPVSTADFTANSANPLYRAVAKTWAVGPDWEPWTGTRDGDQTHYRSTRVFNSPPYEAYTPKVTASTRNDIIIARMVAGNDFGNAPATWDGAAYTNASIADMYVLPQWSQFGAAMEAVALGECGGTLTLQTKLNGTSPAADPFKYQNTGVKDSAGAPLTIVPTVVTTSQQFITGTFDFAVPNGEFVTVDVLPQNYTELVSYTPGTWTCRAGNANRPFELIDIPDAGAWKGVRVRIAANEAVSCNLSVTK